MRRVLEVVAGVGGSPSGKLRRAGDPLRRTGVDPKIVLDDVVGSRRVNGCQFVRTRCRDL